MSFAALVAGACAAPIAVPRGQQRTGVVQSWVEAVNRHQPTAALGYMAENMTVIEDFQGARAKVLLTGRAQVRSWLESKVEQHVRPT
jgi:hypothetical protein